MWDVPVRGKTVTIKEGSNPGKIGFNSFDSLGYQGPCPIFGVHKYYFKVYALNKKLELENGTMKKEIDGAIEGSVLESKEIIGIYSKSG